MINTLLDIVRKADTDGWQIIDTKVKGWEFYFIRHDLDQNRAKDVEHISLTVYKKTDDGKEIGRANASLSPTNTKEELEKTVNDLIYQATLVTNSIYTLTPKSEEKPQKAVQIDLQEEAKKFIDTFNAVHETETEDLNSYEIFTDLVTRRIITSEGIDVTETYPTSTVEVVVNARRGKHEIELYRLYGSGTCNQETLQKDIEDTMRFGKDRLDTKPTPNLGKASVLFSTDAAINIYEYFLDNLLADFVYRKMSSFKINQAIFENAEGDQVTLKAVPYLENSNCNFDYDAEGAPIYEKVLIDQGIPKAYHGGRMFSQYLNLDDSFIVSNWKVSGGTNDEAALREGDYLEIVEFSDFQVNPITGDIFGEIRLGYYHHDGQVTPISGGSVSGDIKECLKKLHMSKQTRTYNNVEIPLLTKLEDVTITGAE